MKRLMFKSWLLILYIEFVMRFRDFRALHTLVRDQEVCAVPVAERCSSEALCHALDLACVFYFQPVLCLQRSVAATLLLRHNGWPAEMVIGLQMLPLRSHAWVELDGIVINDKPYMAEMYRELQRC